jgi:hypothetical protein
VRWGIELLLEKEEQVLRGLRINLKAECHGGSLENFTEPRRSA